MHRHVLDVEVTQLTDCSTHVGSVEWWQPAGRREQRVAVDLRAATK